MRVASVWNALSFQIDMRALLFAHPSAILQYPEQKSGQVKYRPADADGDLFGYQARWAMFGAAIQ
jgi:hypothetical protein